MKYQTAQSVSTEATQEGAIVMATSREELRIKRLEFRFSDGTVSCDKCSRTIPVGQPYAIKRQVECVENDFMLVESRECLRLCTEARPCAIEVPERAKPSLPKIRAEWDSLPDVAAAAHRDGFPIDNLNGERIANGYNSILELTPDAVFLECEAQQVNQAMFAHEARATAAGFGRSGSLLQGSMDAATSSRLGTCSLGTGISG